MECRGASISGARGGKAGGSLSVPAPCSRSRLSSPQAPAARPVPRSHGEYDPCLSPPREVGAPGARVSGGPSGAGDSTLASDAWPAAHAPFPLYRSLAKSRRSRTSCSQPGGRTPNVRGRSGVRVRRREGSRWRGAAPTPALPRERLPTCQAGGPLIVDILKSRPLVAWVWGSLNGSLTGRTSANACPADPGLVLAGSVLGRVQALLAGILIDSVISPLRVFVPRAV